MLSFPCNDELIFLSNGWVFAKWNVLSNLSYLLFSSIGMFQLHHSPATSRFLTLSQQYHLYVMLGLLGLSSLIYHSSLQFWSITLDFLTIQTFSFSVLWMICSYSKVYMFVMILLIQSSTVMFILLFYSDEHYNVSLQIGYNLCLVLLFVLIVWNLWKHFQTFSSKDPFLIPFQTRILVAIMTFFLAFVCYLMVFWYCPVRGQYPWYQMHSYWHLLSAISLYFLIDGISLLPKNGQKRSSIRSKNRISQHRHYHECANEIKLLSHLSSHPQL